MGFPEKITLLMMGWTGAILVGTGIGCYFKSMFLLLALGGITLFGGLYLTIKGIEKNWWH